VEEDWEHVEAHDEQAHEVDESDQNDEDCYELESAQTDHNELVLNVDNRLDDSAAHSLHVDDQSLSIVPQRDATARQDIGDLLADKVCVLAGEEEGEGCCHGGQNDESGLQDFQ